MNLAAAVVADAAVVSGAVTAASIDPAEQTSVDALLASALPVAAIVVGMKRSMLETLALAKKTCALYVVGVEIGALLVERRSL